MHDQLGELVARHAQSHFQKPIADVNRQACTYAIDTWCAAGKPTLILDAEMRMSFWMKDTPLDLDIAFIARDGTVLEVRTMTSGDTETTTSTTDQVRFAIEMRAGWFGHFGVKPGDKVNIDDLRAALKARGFDPKRFIP